LDIIFFVWNISSYRNYNETITVTVHYIKNSWLVT